MDADSFLIAGGYTGVRGHLSSAYIYNRVTGWVRLPNMLEARSNMACGLIKRVGGEKEVVVVGGNTYSIKTSLFLPINGIQRIPLYVAMLGAKGSTLSSHST